MSTTETIPALNTIVHTEIGTNDLNADTAFLNAVFGWTLDDAPGDRPYKMINGPNGPVGGLYPVTLEQDGPTTTSYINVADLDDAANTVTANGGKIVVPIQDVPNMGRFFWFTTPGGCVLACWQATN